MTLRVEILAPACCGSRRLAVAVRDALDRAQLNAELVEVTGYAEIAPYGVMSVPALAIDGVPVCVGRVPLVAEIVAWVEAACHSPRKPADRPQPAARLRTNISLSW